MPPVSILYLPSLGLTVAEQNRLHTFRLASNAVLNRQAEPSREKLLRDSKTVSFFVKRITGEDIPADLYRLFPQADATYIAAPPAKERVRRMRVNFQYADTDYLYVLPVDSVADEPLRVRYNVPQINDEFAETCGLLWRHAQINLLDVAVDGAGVLTPSFIILEPDYPGRYQFIGRMFQGIWPSSGKLYAGKVADAR